MSERDIDFLLDLYEQPYVKGEQRSNDTKNKINIESKRKNRHLILDELLLEARILVLTPNQKQLVRELIDDFNSDFQNLHRQASEECIILAFIFFVKKLETPRIKLSNYRITKKYKLTDQIFENILCRLALKFMQRVPIVPRQTSKDEHDVLIREGKR